MNRNPAHDEPSRSVQRLNRAHLDLLGGVDGKKHNLGEAPAVKWPVADTADDPPAALDDRHADVVLIEHQAGDVLPGHLG